MASVIVLLEDGSNVRKTLKHGPLSIGRDDSNGLALPDGYLSRRHCILKLVSDHQVVLEDLGSSNGTHVNGSRVSGNLPVGPGDVIRIGRTRMFIDFGPEPAEGDVKVLYPSDESTSGKEMPAGAEVRAPYRSASESVLQALRQRAEKAAASNPKLDRADVPPSAAGADPFGAVPPAHFDAGPPSVAASSALAAAAAAAARPEEAPLAPPSAPGYERPESRTMPESPAPAPPPSAPTGDASPLSVRGDLHAALHESPPAPPAAPPPNPPSDTSNQAFIATLNMAGEESDGLAEAAKALSSGTSGPHAPYAAPGRPDIPMPAPPRAPTPPPPAPVQPDIPMPAPAAPTPEPVPSVPAAPSAMTEPQDARPPPPAAGRSALARLAEIESMSTEDRVRENLRVMSEVTAFLSTGSFEAEDFLGFAMQKALEVVPSERAILLLFDPRTRRIYPGAFRAAYPERADELRRHGISHTITKRALTEQVALVVGDAGGDVRFSGSDSVVMLRLKSVLAVPMLQGQVVRGLIYFDNRVSTNAFGRIEVDLGNALANLVTVGLSQIELRGRYTSATQPPVTGANPPATLMAQRPEDGPPPAPSGTTRGPAQRPSNHFPPPVPPGPSGRSSGVS